jgi:hypothetical protein
MSEDEKIILDKIDQLPEGVRREFLIFLFLRYPKEAAEANMRTWWPNRTKQPDDPTVP